jgi:hypothetical protein
MLNTQMESFIPLINTTLLSTRVCTENSGLFCNLITCLLLFESILCEILVLKCELSYLVDAGAENGIARRIISPRHPQSYTSSLNKTWKILAPRGHKVNLNYVFLS